ncbi:unnamed protein product [Lepeophtheirus salmonis]|uniref:(salmon louse) hypothetical protein n=1 Tax=Lepeophtheirus salmonis TaxID=72036 RepID=A0A817FDQ4_LEPSM|nr:unnamed protein product [Lepeophtheirus salmonis]
MVQIKSVCKFLQAIINDQGKDSTPLWLIGEVIVDLDTSRYYVNQHIRQKFGLSNGRGTIRNTLKTFSISQQNGIDDAFNKEGIFVNNLYWIIMTNKINRQKKSRKKGSFMNSQTTNKSFDSMTTCFDLFISQGSAQA